MPDAPKTPHRVIRIDTALWVRFGEVAQRLGTDRSVLIREFVRWFVRERGAKLPQRPEA